MPNNVMSLPNRGDTTRGDNKKKSIGGVDASMITRMKREQAIVSDQRTEPGRYLASVAITDITGGDGTGPLVYTFTSPGYVPFVPGEQVAVTGNAGVVTTSTSATASSTAAATIVATLSAVAANGVLTVSSTTSNATLKVGQRLQVATTDATHGLTTSLVVYIKAVSGSNITVTTDEAGTTLLTTTAGSSSATLNVTAGGSIITMTYGGGVTTAAAVFLSGDSIAITGHSNTGSTGVAIPSSGTETLLTTKNTVLSSTATQVLYQTTATFTAGTLTASSTAVTITPTSSRYNGNFNITACTTTSVTMALPAGNGPSILGAFTNGRDTGTITGNRPIGQIFQPIVDGQKTRGFTEGPVMPFFRRSASLGFYRVV